MPTSYELPSIILRNARYRGHRESEKRLGSHNEQVYDIHRIARKLIEQNKQIDEATKEWFNGNIEQTEVINTIDVSKSFPVNINQTMYHVIQHYDIRKVNNVMVKLNNVTINNSKYKVLHGSIYIDLESILSVIPINATLEVTMNVDIAVKNSTNVGIKRLLNNVKHLDERIKETERKYLEYESAYE